MSTNLKTALSTMAGDILFNVKEAMQDAEELGGARNGEDYIALMNAIIEEATRRRDIVAFRPVFWLAEWRGPHNIPHAHVVEAHAENLAIERAGTYASRNGFRIVDGTLTVTPYDNGNLPALLQQQAG